MNGDPRMSIDPARAHADFQAWLSRVMSENIVPSGVKPPVGARLLVCSTCSDDYPPCDTYAALAVIEGKRPA